MERILTIMLLIYLIPSRIISYPYMVVICIKKVIEKYPFGIDGDDIKEIEVILGKNYLFYLFFSFSFWILITVKYIL